MKGTYLILFATVSAFIVAGTVFAMQHEATVDKGKALFNDPKLGTTGKSCNDCHKSGKGLEKAGEIKDLEKTVNSCIKASLKGKVLKVNSVEMQSLILYIKSIKPAVGC